MGTHSIFYTLTAFLVILLFESSLAAEPTLRFLSILHRHGARAPIETYPLDPYKNDSFWPDGRKELVKVGKVNMFELGKYFRKRYDGFLPAKYKASEVLVRSTAVNRAIVSAKLVLAGLYSPKSDQIWTPDLPWQPIPVLVLDRANDTMLCISKTCPRLGREYLTFKLGQNGTWMDARPDIVNYLRNHTGLLFESKHEHDLHRVWDSLLVQDEQGYKLPEWANSVHPDKIASLVREVRAKNTRIPGVSKLKSGVLINDILSDMRKKTEKKNKFERLLNLYSGHDLTVLNLWDGMGITQEMPMPGYGASIIIELHKIKRKYRVKVLYKQNATDSNLTVWSVKGCEADQELHRDDMCNLDVFDSALQSVKITDFDKECFSPLGLGMIQLWAQC